MKLSKMFGLLHTVDGNNTHEKQERRVRLTFELTRDFPGEVIEREGKYSAIGKEGRDFVYFIDSLEIGSNDIARMELEKGRIIEKVVGRELGENFRDDRIAEEELAGVLTDYPEAKRAIMLYILRHDIFGYGPFSMLMEDKKNIEEIVVNAPNDNIGVYHSKYGYCKTNMKFRDEGGFRYAINRLLEGVDKELNSNTPIIDAQFADGSRIHAQGAPYATRGAAASIRLSGSKFTDIRNMMSSGSVSAEELAYLWMAIETGCNIVVSGAPSSGKTTLLLALSCFVPRYQRIITIEEEVDELRYYSNFMNSVPLQGSAGNAKVTVRDQIINALHLRPDRLIVGEIRGGETASVFSGANLGVPFMTTMHSSTDGKALINRLQSKPMSVEPQSISMLDVAVFMRTEGLSKRKISGISEYRWLSRSEISMDDGAEYKISAISQDGALEESAVKQSKALELYSKSELISGKLALKEFKRRVAFLRSISLDISKQGISEVVASYGDIK